ncbi:thioesterase family protein [Stachybotrys elegans]|uniref:Thioesterase family protein n=1 Tax=Stachybotrys elegans TaxID=80388 RepID=A0A8K0SEJ7_9HYPO|nr:thioesterase family protein [Stachybotrys elegans]
MATKLQDNINLCKTATGTYIADSPAKWSIGATLHGGYVAAVIHHAITTHVQQEPSLVALNQPDVLKLHLQFVRGCESTASTINIAPIKTGGGISVFQVQLSQKNQLRVLALATMTDFAKSLGPSHATAWKLHPPPAPIPDFELVENARSEPNWLPVCMAGEVLAASEQLIWLQPRGGFPDDGKIDFWNHWHGGQTMDATCMALMSDMIPSMSDTLLRNTGLYDAHKTHRITEAWAAEHPGQVCVLRPKMSDITKAGVFNMTVTLDIEFKRRLPEQGLRWVFTRIESRMMEAGRMDLDITLCDEQMGLVCVAHQLVVVVEAQRKMRTRAAGTSSL